MELLSPEDNLLPNENFFVAFDDSLFPTLKDLESSTEEVKPKPRKCQVCTGIAGKHNYYGANVCISCRGFFRRSVQSQQYTVFTCTSNNQCVIDSKSRKSCKKCRFAKCVASGMRTAWVLTPAERKHRLIARNQQKVDHSLTLHFTREERNLVDKLISLIYTFAYNRYYQKFGEDLDLFRAWLGAIYHGEPMTYSMLKKIENIDLEAMSEKGYTVLDGILDKSDLKMALIRKNHTSLFGLYWSTFCQSRDMDEFIREFVRYGHENPHMPGVGSTLKELSKAKVLHLKSAWNYKVMYSSPWAPCADIEDRHYKLSWSICRWPRQKDEAIDKAQLVLLTMVLLLSSNDEEVYENVKIIEHSQMPYVMMLYRYLRDKHQDDYSMASTTFANGIQIISKAKEVYDMHKLMLPI